MIRQVLSQFHLPGIAVFGLLLFGVLFVSALLWVYRKSGDSIYQALEKLPLQEDVPS